MATWGGRGLATDMSRTRELMQIYNCQPLELPSSHQQYFPLPNCPTWQLSQPKGIAADRTNVTVSTEKSAIGYLMGSRSFFFNESNIYVFKETELGQGK